MSGWPMVALGEMFDIARGGSPRPIADYITDDDDGINWIKIGDASASSKFIRTTKQRIKPSGLKKTRQVGPGDFLLTNSMSFGRPYIMATEGCIHDGWLALRPGTREFSADYFYHLLSTDAVFDQFAARAGGSTVKNLNSELVSSVEVPLPPLAEQKRIAAILDQADALRRRRRDALALLDTLTQSVFVEMFGGRFFGEASLSDLGEVKTGATPPTKDGANFGDDIPFVTPGDLESNSPTARFLSEVGASKSRTVRGGATLVCCIGATIGKMSSVSDRVAFNQQINAVEWGNEIDPMYGRWAMEILRPMIIHRGKGAATTLPILKKSEFAKLTIQVPPREQQNGFARRVRTIADHQGTAGSTATHLDTLFASLQSRAFAGEL